MEIKALTLGNGCYCKHEFFFFLFFLSGESVKFSRQRSFVFSERDTPARPAQLIQVFCPEQYVSLTARPRGSSGVTRVIVFFPVVTIRWCTILPGFQQGKSYAPGNWFIFSRGHDEILHAALLTELIIKVVKERYFKYPHSSIARSITSNIISSALVGGHVLHPVCHCFQQDGVKEVGKALSVWYEVFDDWNFLSYPASLQRATLAETVVLINVGMNITFFHLHSSSLKLVLENVGFQINSLLQMLNFYTISYTSKAFVTQIMSSVNQLISVNTNPIFPVQLVLTILRQVIKWQKDEGPSYLTSFQYAN